MTPGEVKLTSMQVLFSVSFIEVKLQSAVSFSQRKISAVKEICIKSLKLISSVYVFTLQLLLKKQPILQRLFYIKISLIKIYH